MIYTSMSAEGAGHGADCVAYTERAESRAACFLLSFFLYLNIARERFHSFIRRIEDRGLGLGRGDQRFTPPFPFLDGCRLEATNRLLQIPALVSGGPLFRRGWVFLKGSKTFLRLSRTTGGL